MIAALAGIIKQVMPHCKDPAGWAPHLHSAMARFGISGDKDVVAAFLAQIAVESAELNRLDENLNYSAERHHRRCVHHQRGGHQRRGAAGDDRLLHFGINKH